MLQLVEKLQQGLQHWLQHWSFPRSPAANSLSHRTYITQIIDQNQARIGPSEEYFTQAIIKKERIFNLTNCSPTQCVHLLYS